MASRFSPLDHPVFIAYSCVFLALFMFELTVHKAFSVRSQSVQFELSNRSEWLTAQGFSFQLLSFKISKWKDQLRKYENKIEHVFFIKTGSSFDIVWMSFLFNTVSELSAVGKAYRTIIRSYGINKINGNEQFE